VSFTHAFRWTTSGVLADITPPGFVFAAALDVNDAGYVAGYGWRAGENVQALRWPPGAGNQAVILGEGEATTVAHNGDALGMANQFTTTRCGRSTAPQPSYLGPR
jgi:hypothetical protein